MSRCLIHASAPDLLAHGIKHPGQNLQHGSTSSSFSGIGTVVMDQPLFIPFGFFTAKQYIHGNAEELSQLRQKQNKEGFLRYLFCHIIY